MSFVYNVDNEIKQEYLLTKPTATASSDSFILRSADEHENLINKPLYMMSHSDLREMISSFKNSTVKTIVKNISILSMYIDFCITKGLVPHMENRLKSFTMTDAKNYVNMQAKKKRYISKEQKDEYVKLLVNENDKALIECMYRGIKGRADKEGTFEEIINLRKSDIHREDGMLTLVKNNGSTRDIPVDDSFIEILLDTYNQEIYYENNGEEVLERLGSKVFERKINRVEDYIFRKPAKNIFDTFNPMFINSKLRRIQKWVDNRYMTATTLYQSGMLNMCKEIYDKKGELTTEDYKLVCRNFDFREDYEKLSYEVKKLWEEYFEVIYPKVVR